MSSSIMTPAYARIIANADVTHPHYDLPIILIKESVINADRYGATEFSITLTDEPDKNAWKRELKSNGSGEADFDRMKAPSESNGLSTSRYGVGLWAEQLSGDPKASLPAHRVAKTAGKLKATYVATAPFSASWSPYPMHISDPDCPFKTPESSGFFDSAYILKDRIPNVKSLNDFAVQIREMICVNVDQAVLNKMCVTLTINGQLISDSRRDNWQSLDTVLGSHGSVASYGSQIKRSGAVTMTANFYRIGRKIDIPHFPNYGRHSASSSLVHMHQEGFQNHEMPIHTAFGRALHPTSQNGCVAIVTFTASSPSELPTPAATRTSYLPTCETYKRLLSLLVKMEPDHWINSTFPDPVRPPAVPDAPAPAPAREEHPSDSEESSSSKKARKPRGPMSEEAKAAMKAKRDATIAAKKAAAAEAVVVVPTVTETDAAKIARLEATVAEQATTIAEQATTIAEQATTIAELQFALLHARNNE